MAYICVVEALDDKELQWPMGKVEKTLYAV